MNLTAPHEPSTWLAGRIADLTRSLDQDRARAAIAGVFVFAELSERPAGRRARQRWDRTCDRCGTYVPAGGDFYMAALETQPLHGARLVVTFGLCKQCAVLEYGAQVAEQAMA